MQAQIDDGLLYCAPCDHFGRNTFCGQCGNRFIGRDLDWRTCPTCKVYIATPFCSLCGYEVLSEELKRWEDGDIDLDAEEEHAAGELGKMLGKHEALQYLLFDDAQGEGAPDVVSLVHMLNQGFGRPSGAGKGADNG